MRKALKVINIIIKYSIFALGAGLMVAHFASPDNMPKAWSYFATMALVFIPDIVRMMKIKISAGLEFWYYVFIIPAMVLGIDFELYKVIYPLDKIVHGFSGVLTAWTAKDILKQLSSKPDDRFFKVLFIIGFVALIAVIWECFEFMCDQLFGQNMQQLVVPGVADTMWDMIIALIGGTAAIAIMVPRQRR